MKIDKPQPLQKNYLATDKAIDEEQRIIDHAISDDAEDRDGDDITLDAWQTDNYMRNPVVCEAHNSCEPAIGKCISLYKQGNQLRAKTQFAPTERGLMFFELYKGGYMNAFSVSFIPKAMEPKGSLGRGKHITECELLEYSCVVVPANPRATKGLEDEATDKTGAVLNKSNAEMIKQAVDQLKLATDLLAKVLQSAEPEDDPAAANDPPNPDNPTPKDEQPEDLNSMLLTALKP